MKRFHSVLSSLAVIGGVMLPATDLDAQLQHHGVQVQDSYCEASEPSICPTTPQSPA